MLGSCEGAGSARGVGSSLAWPSSALGAWLVWPSSALGSPEVVNRSGGGGTSPRGGLGCEGAGSRSIGGPDGFGAGVRSRSNEGSCDGAGSACGAGSSFTSSDPIDIGATPEPASTVGGADLVGAGSTGAAAFAGAGDTALTAVGAVFAGAVGAFVGGVCAGVAVGCVVGAVGVGVAAFTSVGAGVVTALVGGTGAVAGIRASVAERRIANTASPDCGCAVANRSYSVRARAY